jgi:hypothetical protein
MGLQCELQEEMLKWQSGEASEREGSGGLSAGCTLCALDNV